MRVEHRATLYNLRGACRYNAEGKSPKWRETKYWPHRPPSLPGRHRAALEPLTRHVTDSEERQRRPSLGQQVAAFIEEGLAPENSYRLEKQEGELLWGADGYDGKPVLYSREPKATVWRRMLAWLLSLLPIERML